MSSTGHNSADMRLRSLIDRVGMLGSRSDVSLFQTIGDRMARLQYVLAPLSCIGRHGWTIAADRAAVAGGKLLGIDRDTVRHRAAMVKRRGSVCAAVAAIESWLPDAWPVPPLDGDLLGFVYLMEAERFPGVVKIGFSRNPKRRLRQLELAHKIDLRLVCYAPGTEFAEHMIQHEFARFSLASEWFDTGGDWAKRTPEVRFYTPDRMWNEMREAA